MLAQLIGLVLRLVRFLGGVVGVTQLARIAWRKWGTDPRHRLRPAWRQWAHDPLIREALGYREWMVKRARERPAPFVEDMLSDTNGLLDCLVELAASRADLLALEGRERAGDAPGDAAGMPVRGSKAAILEERMAEILAGLRDAYQGLVFSQAPDLASAQSRLRLHHESLGATTRAVQSLSGPAPAPGAIADDEETPGKASA